jgi:hypothetical protein
MPAPDSKPRRPGAQSLLVKRSIKLQCRIDRAIQSNRPVEKVQRTVSNLQNLLDLTPRRLKKKVLKERQQSAAGRAARRAAICRAQPPWASIERIEAVYERRRVFMGPVLSGFRLVPAAQLLKPARVPRDPLTT